MVDLTDFAVDANRDTAFALSVFEREGILVAKNALPTTLARDVADFLRRSLEEIDKSLRRYGFSLHDDDAARHLTALMQDPPADLSERDRHMLLGHFPLEVRLAEELRTIPRFLGTHPLLFTLLSTRRLYVHMPPTARYVLPHCSLARVPLHQDVSYNRHMEDFCVVWVPLVPIDQACGGMAAFARTHRVQEIVLERRQNAADGWLPAIEEGAVNPARRVVLAPLEVGDLVVMTKNTLHESMPNLSDRMRLSCDFRFFGEGSRSTKHYLDIAADTVVAPPAAAER
ncbi:MAG: phytanoyl-CoA dioxygenase family protein [Pseudomonadota bacterium]